MLLLLVLLMWTAPLLVEVEGDGPVRTTLQRGTQGSNPNEAEGLQFLQRYDDAASFLCNLFMEASWLYNTNVTEHNKRNMISRQLQWSQFHRSSYEEGRQFRWRSFAHAAVRRMFGFITVLGRAALPDNQLREYAELLQQMKALYSTARVCPPAPDLKEGRRKHLKEVWVYDDYDLQSEGNRTCLPTLSLEPDLTRLLQESRDPRVLRYVWRSWRRASGAPLRTRYQRFITLANNAAKLNGFSDAGEYWRSEYEVGDLEEDLEELWRELKPLYLQLHAFVRRKLRLHYGANIVPETGPIPAHLLGNMWAQDWSGVLPLTLPFPGQTPHDVTEEMIRQGYSPVRIFRTADNFYRSLGLEAVPVSFWRDSMFSKPRDREVVCHASAWDMCNNRDYRVKMCTDVTMEDLIKAHHEMGHIQYDMLYRNQPFIFRDGANPGFHEAVGDVVALSAATPQHLKALGLMSARRNADITQETQTDLNHLFTVAMAKIAFLPFALVLDKWRWRVFSGEIPQSTMNKEWWKLRMEYSGVSPPVVRDEDDFDPGAKYHVPANTPYVRYLVSFILQFQLHETLCEASGHVGPLHTCSIYGSSAAGELLRRGLSLGRSEPWPTVMAQLTNGRYKRLNAGPILKYFQPLHDWLQQQNNDTFVGWRSSEALIAGQQYSSSATTAAYVLMALLFLTMLLGMACLLTRRWRKSVKEEDSAEQR
uniref:Angiotensin-converting enzyme n=1 Tax=Hirondellea gigas TaxID=1518452 RepID=A0A6A7G2J0_9CRUS